MTESVEFSECFRVAEFVGKNDAGGKFFHNTALARNAEL